MNKDKVCGIIDTVFNVLIVITVAIAIIAVFLQIVSVVILNGNLSTVMEKTLAWSTRIGSIATALAFIMGYVYHWKPGE